MNININSQPIGKGQFCFVIAEIGINHNGSLDTALNLIDVAVIARCNAVKFQKRTVPVVYSAGELAKPRAFHRSILDAGIKRGVFSLEDLARLETSDYQNTTNGDLKRALEFGPAEYARIDAYCKDVGIAWSVSPWDEQAVDDVAPFQLSFWKIASASLTDDGLLRKIRSAANGVPVILSTGMSTMEQVAHAVDVLGKENLILLHTVSTYPAEESELNLRVIQTLKDAFPEVPVGYSGHERGTTLSVCAVALGACVIERHITLDRTSPGSDHAASLEPEGIKRVVDNIRRLEKAMGDGAKRVLPTEVPIQAKLRRK